MPGYNSGGSRGGGFRGGGGGGGHRSGGGGGFRGGGGGFRGGGDRRPPMQDREMHKATCDKCKQECEVPFKPTQGKPVYCKDCYKKMKGY